LQYGFPRTPIALVSIIKVLKKSEVKDNKVNECTLTTKLKGEGSCGGEKKKHIHTHSKYKSQKIGSKILYKK
jgi:hypothetical protein